MPNAKAFCFSESFSHKRNSKSSASSSASHLHFFGVFGAMDSNSGLFSNQIGKYDSVIAVEKPLPTPDCAAWNHTRICPKIQPTFSEANQRSGSQCPDYFRWIHEDLRHWRSTGITEEMVVEARRTAHFRITILGGKMYVENFEEAFQSRGSFTLWGFAQLMRRYGGKLPDLELMFDCNDRPVVEAEKYEAAGAIPPPLFKYCADNRTVDIVFPDWSFWGW